MSKILKKILIIVTILILLSILLFKVIKIQNIILKQIYPIHYKEYVDMYSKENNIDPFLVFAIIKAESNFEEKIVSTSGAIGLMQLMENTAKETSRKIGYEFNNKSCLYNAETNIKLGTKYFSDLLKLYDNNIPLALTAYNAGIGNVSRWIENGIIKKDGTNIENIPFKETNNYVRKILRDYKIYKELYK